MALYKYVYYYYYYYYYCNDITVLDLLSSAHIR